MNDKMIVITGATDGIGKVTVRELYKQGYSLALVGRNKQKLDQVKSELSIYTKGNGIFLYQADLSLLKETRRVGEEIRKAHPKIYCLLNNAGAYFSNRILTTEGIESTFALNHMNYFIMAHELLPSLENNGNARIVNVASRAHVGVSLGFQNMFGEVQYSGWKQYQRSKLMNIYFTYLLSEKLQSKNITVNCLHPGFVKTKFGQNNEGFARTLLTIGQNLFAINEDEGAATSIYLASSHEIEGITGKYFVKSKIQKSSPQSFDQVAAKTLWDLTEKIMREAG
jgi:NAD(P)-dependent dehydrogenase (short-subunit alcohol dehydrogenase family)